MGTGGTYPRPDEPLLALLTGIGEKWYATSRDAVNALHTFFAILFERIKEEMVSLKLNERDVGAFALIWQEHLQTTDRREAIYNDVESAYGVSASLIDRLTNSNHRIASSTYWLSQI